MLPPTLVVMMLERLGPDALASLSGELRAMRGHLAALGASQVATASLQTAIDLEAMARKAPPGGAWEWKGPRNDALNELWETERERIESEARACERARLRAAFDLTPKRERPGKARRPRT